MDTFFFLAAAPDRWNAETLKRENAETRGTSLVFYFLSSLSVVSAWEFFSSSSRFDLIAN